MFITVEICFDDDDCKAIAAEKGLERLPTEDEIKTWVRHYTFERLYEMTRAARKLRHVQRRELEHA